MRSAMSSPVLDDVSLGHFTAICYDAIVVRLTRPALLLVLLAGFPLLALLPSEAGNIRIAGLSLLWWYGAVAVPALAWVITVLLHR